MKELTACTDLELYNCPKMTQFPVSIGQMPELVSLNISNNLQWSAEECLKGFNALAEGASKEKLQILYMRENNLEEIPLSIRNMKKIGLLDFAYNKIKTTPAWGKEIAPMQLYLDNNQLESLPVDEEGYFCAYDDMENFSVRFNKLKKFPNIFSAKSLYTIKSVDFSGNDIRGFEGEEDGSFRGLKVETLSLSQNYNLKKYPAALWKSGSLVAYIVLRACGLEEFPADSFKGDQVINLVSLDLSYNNLTDLPWEMNAANVPYLYGVDLSFNSFSKFPYEPLDAAGLTVLSVRSQRDSEGRRCLREWPTGIYQHVGLRGLYLGSNDLREVNDTISTLCYYLDISDNPNIVFDASDICYAWQAGAYILYYDKTQNIKNCDLMLE
jgi:Leucine-rich repeat (LRR) protein